MKKIILPAIALLLASVAIVYLLNPAEIYKLSDKTAKFIDQQTVPDGLVSLKAADCGACHVEIYREWQTSLHAKAFNDPFFQAYHRKDKGDPTCLKCHTPLLNQSPVVLSSASGNYDDLKITDNPDFDAELQQEGVTCSGCHVRDGIVYGPYAASSMNAPHPVAYDEQFLSQSLCNQCHEVPSKDFSLMNEGICSTGMEFEQGPWAEQGVTCQHCHMPEVNRALVAGYPERPGRKHLWPGAYSSQQLRKAFDFAARRDGQRLTITIRNSGAGHKVPTGDPDRFVVLDFYWQAVSGEQHKLQSITFQRQVVWQPLMFVWSDNRLAPGQALDLEMQLPAGKGTLMVNGSYHVMTQRQLERLQDNYGLNNAWPITRPFIDRQTIAVAGQ